jgi:VanZ family protein
MSAASPPPPRLAPGLVRLGVLLTLVALPILTGLLLMPGQEGPAMIPGLDKVFHFIGFFGLVLPFAMVRPQQAWIAALVAAGYGGVIELIQPSFGRGAEWGDAFANLAGAMSAAAMGRWLHPRLARRFPRPR